MNTQTIEAKPKRRGPTGPRIDGGSPDARKLAAAIMDVMAGARTPGDAAASVNVSVARYYALEARAFEGLVKACEPRPKGRTRAPEKEISGLRKEVERLKRECDRRQALVRAAQRAVGLSAPASKPDAKRKRRPTVRALKAAQVLRSEPAASVAEVTQPSP